MKKKRRTYNVVIERDKDGWLVASVPALPGCHTQAKFPRYRHREPSTLRPFPKAYA